MGKKLLVADDSVTIQKVIKLALASEGYDILAVSDGKEATRAIQEERPDIVLIDIALPGSDAFAVKRAADEDPSFSGTAFVLMVSAFERLDEKKISEAVFHGRLIKPFDPGHLRKIVSQALGAATDAPQGRENVSPDVRKEAESSPPSVEEGVDLPPMEPPDEEVIPALITKDSIALTGLLPIEPPPAAPPADLGFAPLDLNEDETGEAETLRERELENDIKGLTESTIKMSGLDEFEWNLDDSKKMKSSPYSPPSAEQKTERKPEAPKTRAPLVTVPSRPIDDGGSAFLSMGFVAKQPPSLPPQESATTAEPGFAGLGGASLLTRAEVEAIIQKEATALVEKLAREAVPRIAETVIRKEIERILTEN
ncbi:MAG: response regulator [Deltaproteobacteria bacterium]|nr:response regulator [Deltaproteobacteria bacterium]